MRGNTALIMLKAFFLISITETHLQNVFIAICKSFSFTIILLAFAFSFWPPTRQLSA